MTRFAYELTLYVFDLVCIAAALLCLKGRDGRRLAIAFAILSVPAVACSIWGIVFRWPVQLTPPKYDEWKVVVAEWIFYSSIFLGVAVPIFVSRARFVCVAFSLLQMALCYFWMALATMSIKAVWM